MGFGFKMPKLKNVAKSFLRSGGGLLPGVNEFMATDKGEQLYTDIHKGLGNLVTGGYLAQKDATAEAKKARDQAASQYQAEIDAAAETARKVAETEEERKRRLAAQGTQMPSTLTGSYLGIPGRVNQSRSLLG